jgi:hypothetical protein
MYVGGRLGGGEATSGSPCCLLLTPCWGYWWCRTLAAGVCCVSWSAFLLVGLFIVFSSVMAGMAATSYGLVPGLSMGWVPLQWGFCLAGTDPALFPDLSQTLMSSCYKMSLVPTLYMWAGFPAAELCLGKFSWYETVMALLSRHFSCLDLGLYWALYWAIFLLLGRFR